MNGYVLGGEGRALSGSQAVGTVRASARELLWGLRAVAREVAGWRERARSIPDPTLRADALRALAHKRGNIEGAALFWTLPDRRERELLGTLVAYEVLADYLDCVSERGAARGVENGRRLHLALVQALEPGAEIADYYRHHSSGEDGGYARALVERCRSGCERFQSYEPLRPLLMRAAADSSVLALNHEPDPARRERALREWAGDLPAAPDAPPIPTGDPTGLAHGWFERAAGASAWLTVLAMLALAAEPARPAGSESEAQRTYELYARWIAPAGAMLDSFSDIAEDRANGEHSYIAYYPSMEAAAARVGELVRRARGEALALPRGQRHAVLLSCMVAFYLSKDSTRAPQLRGGARTLRRAGGPTVELLLPALRLWRTAYGQRTA
jgi:tetraprenyl-beta-curcumene synthase